MTDARLKILFKRAAEIAEEVPEEFQEAAFHRALDALIGTNTTDEAQTYAEYLDEAEMESITGLPKAAAKLVFNKSFDVLNIATGVLGMEALSANQVTKVLNEGYGMVVSNDTVARTLENADGIVSRVRRGGSTLYQVIQPGRVVPGHSRRAAAAKKKAAAKAKPKPKTGAKARTKAKPAAAKRKPAAKKSPPPGGRKKKSSPREIITGLIKSGFFNSARTVGDVVFYLQRKGIEITTRELSGILIRLLQAGLLERTRTPEGRYKYYSAD